MPTAASRLEGDVYVNGNLQAKTLTLPSGTVTNAMVASGAAIAQTKLIGEYRQVYRQVAGTAIVAAAKWEFDIIRGATATVLQFAAAITDTLPSGDHAVTVDLHKGNAGGAFASILTAPITLDSGNALRTAVAATIATAALVADDILRVVVAVSGASGAQGEGLVVAMTLSEDPA